MAEYRARTGLSPAEKIALLICWSAEERCRSPSIRQAGHRFFSKDLDSRDRRHHPDDEKRRAFSPSA
jgi:hypothetical protein